MKSKKHYNDEYIEIYRHTKLAEFIGFNDQFKKTKLIGMSKADLIMLLGGYDLGDHKKRLLTKLSKYYGLTIDELETMEEEDSI